MEFDYFYGQQAEQFSFYRIPKMLFTDDRFWNVSTDAKLLYGILLDRMNLSAKNGWLDENGRVYIIFTLEETMTALNCGDNKATKLYNELEKKCGLIERKRQGLGKPNLIYVKNFVTGVDGFVESRFKSRENHDSGVGKTPILESGKPRGNNTDTIYTDYTITETLEKNVKIEAASREEAEEAVKKAYYNSEYVLDAENFTGVQFATQAERDIQQEQAPKLDVLLVKPGMYPQQVQIGCELEDLQAAVGGHIEAVYPFEDPVAIICNEEGKINGSELNRCLRDDEGQIYDILAGDFLIAGLTEDDFGSLTPEQMQKFEKMFHQPEMFVKMGRSIMALPVPDDRVKKSDAPAKAAPVPHKSSHDRDSL